MMISEIAAWIPWPFSTQLLERGFEPHLARYRRRKSQEHRTILPAQWRWRAATDEYFGSSSSRIMNLINLTLFMWYNDADQFNQAVRVRSIAIRSSSAGQAPKQIKLLINRPSLGFDDLENDNDSAQILELSQEEVSEGKHVALRYVRFQSVNSLHVCVFIFNPCRSSYQEVESCVI